MDNSISTPIYGIKVYIYYYRQTDPTPDNFAARSLNEQTQIKNVRKVKVNAQVTFAIIIFETVGQVSVFVIWTFLRQIEVGVTLALLLFYVLLPYMFLMNTSHNKGLVIDEGWMNTIRNVLGLPNETGLISSLTFPRYLNIIRSSIFDKIENLEQWKRTKDELRRKNTQNTNDNWNPSKDGSQSCGNQGSGIYIITRANESNPIQAHSAHISLNIPEVKPCTSFEEHMLDGKKERKTIAEENKTEADNDNEDNDERHILNRNYRLSHAEQILSNMIININNEDAYMHYMKQLVQLEEVKKDRHIDLSKFQITHLTDAPAPKGGKIKSSKKQKDNLQNTVYFSRSKNVDPPLKESEIKFLGTFSERLYKRKTILENFIQYCSNEESLEMYLKTIFDLEESFISGYFDN